MIPEGHGISILASASVLSEIKEGSGSFVYLINVSTNNTAVHQNAIFNVLDGSCKFIITTGEFVEEFREALLDALSARIDLFVPFFSYNSFEEALEIFLTGDLPIDPGYKRLFLSLSDNISPTSLATRVLEADLSSRLR
jgi:hypothetical protein